MKRNEYKTVAVIETNGRSLITADNQTMNEAFVGRQNDDSNKLRS